MSTKDTNLDPAVELTAVEKLQSFFEKNKNAVLIGTAVIVLLVAGIVYYTAIFMPKAEMEANNAMFDAQYYFEQDSFDLALNSAGGFLEIIEDHGGTKAGNLAHYYAGISYYNLGNFEEAIDHLNAFSTNEDILGSLSLGVLADAQMESGKTDAALANYKKAANFSNNEASAPFLLKKAGIAFEMNGDKKQANTFYAKILKDFPNSQLAQDIEKYIGRTK